MSTTANLEVLRACLHFDTIKKPLPPDPTTVAELRAALLELSSVRRPRSLKKIERQYRAFMLHVVGEMTIRQIARKLGISKNTVLKDLYHESRFRARQSRGLTFREYVEEQSKPDRRIRLDTLNAALVAWGPQRMANLFKTPEGRLRFRNALRKAFYGDD